MRSELRATLNWCLEYKGEFTAKECAAHFNVQPQAIRHQFDKLAEMNLLAKTFVSDGGKKFFLWRVIDLDKATYWATRLPEQRKASVIKTRSNRTVMPKIVVNSVFALGSI